MDRDAILAQYRELREINTTHQSEALKFLSQRGILETARTLGMLYRHTLVAESDEEMTLIFDLGVYGAKQGKSGALDRYRQTLRPPAGSMQARVLDAMRNARFSLWRIERKHEAAGLIVSDVLRETEAWLVDVGLEASGWEGMVFAARLFHPADFWMTSGVIVPVDALTVRDIAEDELAWRRRTPEGVADDPRFAASVYRAALANRMMESVRYE